MSKLKSDKSKLLNDKSYIDKASKKKSFRKKPYKNRYTKKKKGGQKDTATIEAESGTNGDSRVVDQAKHAAGTSGQVLQAIDQLSANARIDEQQRGDEKASASIQINVEGRLPDIMVLPDTEKDDDNDDDDDDSDDDDDDDSDGDDTDDKGVSHASKLNDHILKQYTIGLILPDNTEFYNLPPNGVSAKSFFGNLLGQTVQVPTEINPVEKGKKGKSTPEEPDDEKEARKLKKKVQKQGNAIVLETAKEFIKQHKGKNKFLKSDEAFAEWIKEKLPENYDCDKFPDTKCVDARMYPQGSNYRLIWNKALKKYLKQVNEGKKKGVEEGKKKGKEKIKQEKGEKETETSHEELKESAIKYILELQEKEGKPITELTTRGHSGAIEWVDIVSQKFYHKVADLPEKYIKAYDEAIEFVKEKNEAEQAAASAAEKLAETTSLAK